MLLRTTAAIEDVRGHIVAAGQGSVVESYLTQYLLILFAAEMQEEILASLVHRASQGGDPEMMDFIRDAGGKLLRSVEKGEIAGFVSLFDKDVKERLKNQVSDRDVNAYNMVIKARHKVAHGPGAQVTFGDLTDAVDCAKKMLACIRDWMPGQAVIVRSVKT